MATYYVWPIPSAILMSGGLMVNSDASIFPYVTCKYHVLKETIYVTANLFNILCSIPINFASCDTTVSWTD